MDPLVTPADLAARMGGSPDPAKVDAAIADASATVRAFTGQMFTRMTTTDLLKAASGRLRLPQRPVNDVVAVTADGLAVVYVWPGGDWLVVGECVGYALVTWDHGYDTMPDDVVAVTCNVAARALSSPPEDAGVMSRTITNYTESFGPVGAAGPAGLFNDERAILSRYRRPGSSAKLARR